MCSSESGADHPQALRSCQGAFGFLPIRHLTENARERPMANGEVHDSEANGSQDYTNAAATSPPKPLSVHEEDPTSYPPTPTALLGPTTTRETIAIPPPDTGYAWTFLCAGFTIGAMFLLARADRTARANRPELTYTSHICVSRRQRCLRSASSSPLASFTSTGRLLCSQDLRMPAS